MHGVLARTLKVERDLDGVFDDDGSVQDLAPEASVDPCACGRECRGAGVSCPDVESAAAQLVGWYREWRGTGTIRYRGKIQEVMR